MKATLDLTSFRKTFDKYMKVTGQTLQKALNNKLFDCARFALASTDKADVGTVRASLNAATYRYPRITVAEAIVLKGQSHFTQITRTELREKARTLINKKVKSVGFAKSGWIPAIKDMLPSIFGKSFNQGKVLASGKKGGAKPITTISNHMTGEVYNDVQGTTHFSRVESLKNKGAQIAVDKVEADMIKYLERKLEPHNREFNR
jgi:hypothetical protein